MRLKRRKDLNKRQNQNQKEKGSHCLIGQFQMNQLLCLTKKAIIFMIRKFFIYLIVKIASSYYYELVHFRDLSDDTEDRRKIIRNPIENKRVDDKEDSLTPPPEINYHLLQSTLAPLQ